MKPIHSRNELLALAADLSPTKACRRAIAEGDILVLGGFAPAGGFNNPEWIIHVSGKYQEWYLAIVIDMRLRRYRSKYYEKDAVPWSYWIGNPHGKDVLRDGDKPMYIHMRKVLG